jgi:hypothetical protein
VRVFRQEFALEDAIGSHACSFEASMHVTNGIPLGCPLPLTFATVNSVQTLKATLDMLIEVFLKPLRKASTKYDAYQDEFGKSFLVDPELEYTEEGDPKVVINPRSVKAIFLEVETLKAINSMFLQQLESKVRCAFFDRHLHSWMPLSFTPLLV